jgi:hypothetical protein
LTGAKFLLSTSTTLLGFPIVGLTDAENVALLEASGMNKAQAITELALRRLADGGQERG